MKESINKHYLVGKINCNKTLLGYIKFASLPHQSHYFYSYNQLIELISVIDEDLQTLNVNLNPKILIKKSKI